MLVNFWANWCGPSREEFPLLEDATGRHADEGLVVVGALFRDDAEPAAAFVEEQGATWPTMADPDRVIGPAWKVLAPPQMFLVDREGVIREVQGGQVREVEEPTACWRRSWSDDSRGPGRPRDAGGVDRTAGRAGDLGSRPAEAVR